MGTGVIDFGEDDDDVHPSTSKKASSLVVKERPRRPKRVSFNDTPASSGRQKRQSAVNACELMVLYAAPTPVTSSRCLRKISVKVKEEVRGEQKDIEWTSRRSEAANGFICDCGSSPSSSTAECSCDSPNRVNKTSLYCRFCRWTLRSTLEFAQHQREIHGLSTSQIDDVMRLAYDMPDFEILVDKSVGEPSTPPRTSNGRGTADFEDEPVVREAYSPEL
ncbi:hypothetical protein AAVH_06475 [Aphelenchoides avenae]|nr:hypothetical protein AAVH_06475 [Aphelenchus avenae]